MPRRSRIQGMTATQSAFSTAFGLLQGLWISHVVSATAKLGIAAALDAGPRTAAELAVSTGSGPGCLYRLLRTAAALGVLDEDADGRFHANSLTPILRPGPDPNMNAIAAFFSDECTRAPGRSCSKRSAPGVRESTLPTGSLLRVPCPESGTRRHVLSRDDGLLEHRGSVGCGRVRFRPVRHHVRCRWRPRALTGADSRAPSSHRGRALRSARGHRGSEGTRPARELRRAGGWSPATSSRRFRRARTRSC